MVRVVKSACVVVKGAGYLYRGAVVPGTADPDDVKRLVKAGMIVEKAAPKPAGEEPEKKPAARSTAKK